MKKWPEILLKTAEGETLKAIAPYIISASRRTDIPAFYARWFENCWNKGYCKVFNPYSGHLQVVSFINTRCIVFWSKNPKPSFSFLKKLDSQNIKYYFLFTLNDYETEHFEPYLPSLKQRTETFRQLSEMVGSERVIWRFDPVIYTTILTTGTILKRVEKIAQNLHGYTHKLIFSFAQIDGYRKVAMQMKHIGWREPDSTEKRDFVMKLVSVVQSYGINRIYWCALPPGFNLPGVESGRCIDPELVYKLCNGEQWINDLITFSELIQKENKTISGYIKDKGQRKQCGCMVSTDIGHYNTCPHGCIYCYANQNPKYAQTYYQSHNIQSDYL